MTATDAPEVHGWRTFNEYSNERDQLFYPTIVGKELFEENVSFEFADMNDISKHLSGFDFCWSSWRFGTKPQASVMCAAACGARPRGMLPSLHRLAAGGLCSQFSHWQFIAPHYRRSHWGRSAMLDCPPFGCMCCSRDRSM